VSSMAGRPSSSASDHGSEGMIFLLDDLRYCHRRVHALMQVMNKPMRAN
jgi:hypothetical protein